MKDKPLHQVLIEEINRIEEVLIRIDKTIVIRKRYYNNHKHSEVWIKSSSERYQAKTDSILKVKEAYIKTIQAILDNN